MIQKLESGWNESLIEKRLQQGSGFSELLQGMTDEQGKVIFKALGWAIYSNYFVYDFVSERVAVAIYSELEQIFEEDGY